MTTSPKAYVEAALRLIRASRSAEGPPLDEALSLTTDLGIPQPWLEALLHGWMDYAKRYKRPLFRELVSPGAARFLTARVFRRIRLVEAKRICTLCGLETHPPRQTWHKECWEAVEPHTLGGWQTVCRTALHRSEGCCEQCGTRLVKDPWGKAQYEFDHVVAVALGGASTLENTKVLCRKCHLKKTKADMVLIAEARKIR